MFRKLVATAVAVGALAVAGPASATRSHAPEIGNNPQVTIFAAAVRAPQNDPHVLHFKVKLNALSSGDVSVDWKTSGTKLCVPDTDFDSSTGTLVIPAGQRYGFIDITVEPGNDPAGLPRRFKEMHLRLRNLRGGQFVNGRSQMVATGFILDRTIPDM